MRVEVKERWQRTSMKWNQNSTENFLTNRPHICTWKFQIHLVIASSNPLQLKKCFHVHFPFSAGCKPWTSKSHPGCYLRLKKSPLDLNFLQAPPVGRDTHAERPKVRGAQDCACVGVHTISTAGSMVKEQLYLPAGKSPLFCKVYCPSHSEATPKSKHPSKALSATNDADSDALLSYPVL